MAHSFVPAFFVVAALASAAAYSVSRWRRTRGSPATASGSGDRSAPMPGLQANLLDALHDAVFDLVRSAHPDVERRRGADLRVQAA